MAQVLIIDDHNSMREGLELLLRRRGHKTYAAEGGERGLSLLNERGADLVITDLKMARMDGIQVLREVRGRHPDVDVLVITAYGTIEKAVEAMKLGAADFLTKPFSSEEFGVKIDRLLADRAERLRLRRENVALRVENTYLKEEAESRYGAMVGESPEMREVFRWVERVAGSDSTVMIYGESGTGKELVARAIHAGSSAPDRPLHAGELRRSDGRPPGFRALRTREGGLHRCRSANAGGDSSSPMAGTLFLDEIATINQTTQIRLLRVLQERELERVGGEETIPVDVRIIAATNTPVEELQKGDGISGRPVLPSSRRAHHHPAPSGAEERRSGTGPALSSESFATVPTTAWGT